MNKEISVGKLDRSLAYGVAAILLLMPFHAFFTAWAASNFGHFDLIRIWKELLIGILALGSFWVLYKDKNLTAKFIKNRLVQVILVYALVQIAIGLAALAAERVSLDALLYGWIINLRFLAFFLVALVVASRLSLNGWWQKLLLWPAVVVVGFGLIQQFILPADFLRHFGYEPDTLLPYQTIDLKDAYIRLQSTLRGPNPMGAYLIFVITAALGLIISQKHKLKYGAVLVASVLALFFTYSRSAWIGTFLAAATVLWLSLKQPKARQIILLLSVGLVLLSLSAALLLRNNDHAQNIFFHTDENSTSPVSSNFNRAKAIKGGLKDTLFEPLGRGPGTAGPASLRNNNQARISENYYLQLGQEVGFVGLALFITINVYIAFYLFGQRGHLFGAILLASFLGISTANLFLHVWADDTISLVWWGLAGIALSPVILNKKRKHNV